MKEVIVFILGLFSGMILTSLITINRYNEEVNNNDKNNDRN